MAGAGRTDQSAKRRARRRLWGIVAMTLIVSGLPTIPAAAKSVKHKPIKPPRAMIKYVMAHDAVSQPVATQRLELQGRAGPIVGRLREALGSRWGNAWFDHSTGRFEVGVVGGSAQASSARPYLESQGITGETDFVPVRNSDAELEAAKEQLDTKFANLFASRAIITGFSPEDNIIVVQLATNLPESQVAEVQADAKAAPVKMEIVPTPPQDLIVKPQACVNRWHPAKEPFYFSFNILACTRDLRGGQFIGDVFEDVACSLGFYVTNGSSEYVMTAGHCDEIGSHLWVSASTNWTQKNQAFQSFGEETNAYVGPEGDVGYIKISTSSAWFPVNDPSQVASLDPTGPWGENEDQFLENISWNVQNGITCHTGTSSDTQCGESRLLGQSVTIPWEGANRVVNHEVLSTECAADGDSGGTVWGNHSGLGMEDAGIEGNPPNPNCASGEYSYFTEAIQDLWSTTHGGLRFYVPPYGETY